MLLIDVPIFCSKLKLEVCNPMYHLMLYFLTNYTLHPKLCFVTGIKFLTLYYLNKGVFDTIPLVLPHISDNKVSPEKKFIVPKTK